MPTTTQDNFNQLSNNDTRTPSSVRFDLSRLNIATAIAYCSTPCTHSPFHLETTVDAKGNCTHRAVIGVTTDIPLPLMLLIFGKIPIPSNSLERTGAVSLFEFDESL